MPVTLRPIHPDDVEFLYAVYASTREDELALVDWDETQKTAFLRMQFTAQHKYFQEQFHDAAFEIVLLNGKPIGRLYVDRRKDEIRLIDIALLPEHRNGGIGRLLLTKLLAEAAEAVKPVRLHVELFNPALRWYERLGFVKIADHGVYLLLEWSSGSSRQLKTAS
jgi:ribosomal protein S18 acetylase RimI-like enzyme